ncbi:hypothetical protein M514_27302 [Trichuris suis]|uniref:RNA-directed DNA polymerase n=1 Tax=Trichuris suis TaxID=68888 RepID=A0A085MTG9_9BILA|nr:hypothetical protein M514_27302 [Trichuris suis]
MLIPNWNRLHVRNGILWREWYETDGSSRLQFVVPKQAIAELLHLCHSAPTAGHLREEKMLWRVRERAGIPGYRSDVKRYIRTCWECNTRGSPLRKGRALLQPQVATYTWQRLVVDISGPLRQRASGNRYILIVMDAFSKFAEAIPMPNQETTTVAGLLVREIFCQYGVPEVLHTDQGSQFESQLFQDVCQELGIKKTRTTPYHPSGNEQAERMNLTIWDTLAKSTITEERDWDMVLPKVMMAYRATTHSSTGQSPYRMMFGRQCRLPEDIIDCDSTPRRAPKRYIEQLIRALDEVNGKVQSRIAKEAARHKRYYDRCANPQQFKIGDLVFLFLPRVLQGRNKKFRKPWVGPYVIIDQLSSVTYRIQRCSYRRDVQVVHADCLKSCPGDIRLQEQKTGSPSTDQRTRRARRRQELGIKKTRTTPYHPSGNGHAERMNRTIWDMLAKSIITEERDWDMVLPKVMKAYRATPHSSTGQSPYRMMFGRQCRLPEDIIDCDSTPRRAPKRYIEQLIRALDEVNGKAQSRIAKEAARQKRYYDRCANPQQFKVGDLVFLFLPRVLQGRNKKFRKPWVGPYVIIDQVSPVTYRIQRCSYRCPSRPRGSSEILPRRHSPPRAEDRKPGH